MEEADFLRQLYFTVFKEERRERGLLGIIGNFANFHSTSTKAMIRRPPMVSMAITKALFHAYVEPPWEMGIYLTRLNEFIAIGRKE